MFNYRPEIYHNNDHCDENQITTHKYSYSTVFIVRLPMNYIKSGLQTIVGRKENSDMAEDVAEQVSRLVNRLRTSTLYEDRRDTLRALRSMAKHNRVEVGTQAIDALVHLMHNSITNDSTDRDAELIALVLETLRILIDEEDSAANVHQEKKFDQDEIQKLARMIIDTKYSITSILHMIDDLEFNVRLQAIRCLTALLIHDPKTIQDILLENHAASPRIIDLLHDDREVIRNFAILLLLELSHGNVNIQKIIAFEDGFESLIRIIYCEGNSVVSEDCLFLMYKMLKGNPSNVQLFREHSLIRDLQGVLDLLCAVEEERGNLENYWTEERTATVVRTLVSPSIPSDLISNCQYDFHSYGFLSSLMNLLLSPEITAKVLTSVVLAVAEVIRGNQANQDYFETVATNSECSQNIVVILLLSMTNSGRPFGLRLATLYCLQSFLYKNDHGKAHLVQTLLPSTAEVEQVTAGHLICTGLVSSDPLDQWLCACLLMHACIWSTDEKECLLRVQLATDVSEPPKSLLQQVTSILLRSHHYQVRIGLLMLLSGWLAHSPLAVSHFLQQPDNVTYLFGQLRGSEADDMECLTQGLSAFLIGVCSLFNDGSVKKYTKESLVNLVESHIGRVRFVEKLELVTKSEAYARVSQKPQPKGNQARDLLFDHEFTKLFRQLEPDITRTLGFSQAPADSMLLPEAAEQKDRVVDQYKQLIKDQDEQIGRLTARLQTLEMEANRRTEFDQQKQKQEEQALQYQEYQIQLNSINDQLQQLKQYYVTTMDENQANAFAEQANLKSQLECLELLLQQRDAEVHYYQQQCILWQQHIANQVAQGEFSYAIQASNSLVEQLNAQLAFGWQAYEEQAAQLGKLAEENELLKLRLKEAQNSLKWYEMESARKDAELNLLKKSQTALTAPTNGAEVPGLVAGAAGMAKELTTVGIQCNFADPDEAANASRQSASEFRARYEALYAENQDLLLLLADHDQKLKEQKQMLIHLGAEVSSDGEDDLLLCVDCCSPTARAAAEKLKRYLELEVVGDGLIQTGYAEEFIKEASDLDCNFEQPIACRWKNVLNGQAESNWYLMRKVGHRRWPAVIRPGITPKDGNHLIVAGSENSTQQSYAIWISNPALCQRGPGKFSFAYWIYGPVKLEVAAVAAGEYPLKSVGELRPSSCDFKENRGKHCVISIDPIAVPYQIIIKMYTSYNGEGFVAVDDIKYEANVCLSEIESEQPEFTEIDLAPSPHLYATSAAEAECTFDNLCLWRNVLDDQYNWSTVVEVPDKSYLNSIHPNGAFGMIGVQQMTVPGSGYLISPVFYCQRGNGELNFKRWKAGQASFKVCVLKVESLNSIYCTEVQDDFSPVFIPGPIYEPYELAIIGVGEADAGEQFVAIDDIVYKADVCDSPRIGEPEACQALGCNFADGQSCRWLLDSTVANGPRFSITAHAIGVANNVKIKPAVKNEFFLGTLIFDKRQPHAYIESQFFRVSRARILRVLLKRSTWGSEFYICHNQYNSTLPSDQCHLAAGPQLTLNDTRNFAEIAEPISEQDTRIFLVASHILEPISGAAAFGIQLIDLIDDNRQSLCF
ncbi:General vesicular transport factor [Trichinella nelsoni]|uniref:General vesicular transport factor n=1 Tax=Trichinella nelsoni TaxID=6336 RepID=A0A0V0S8G4_9BILA|nr:General vesicular transport factor [Trichinella nelsoni]